MPGTTAERSTHKAAANGVPGRPRRALGPIRRLDRGGWRPHPSPAKAASVSMSNHADQSGLRRLDLNLLPVFAALVAIRRPGRPYGL